VVAGVAKFPLRFAWGFRNFSPSLLTPGDGGSDEGQGVDLAARLFEVTEGVSM